MKTVLTMKNASRARIAVFAWLAAIPFLLATGVVNAQAPLDTAEMDPLEALLAPVVEEDVPPAVAEPKNDTEDAGTRGVSDVAEPPVAVDAEGGFGLEEREREMLRSTLGENYMEKLSQSGAGNSDAPLAPVQENARAEQRPPRRLPERPGIDEYVERLTEDIISYGDVIRIMMIEDPSLYYEGPVAANGTVPVPYLGEFPIVGLTQRQAMDQLKERLEDQLYLDATVSVTLVSRGGGNVYIYGAVNQQGAVEIPKYGRLTILRLLLLSGGLSGWAAPEDTFIMRRFSGSREMERINVNLREIFASSYPESGKDVPLMDGDIVVVPGLNGELYQFMSAADQEVIVVGEVGNPGITLFKAGELRTLMRAIFKAGSFTQFARKDSVKVIRYDRDRSRREMVVDVDAIMNGDLHKDIELQSGDMVIVPQRKINF